MRRQIHVYLIFLAIVSCLLGVIMGSKPLLELSFNDYVTNVFIEAHGLLFDIIFFGIIYFVQQSIYEKIKEKKELSKEIDNLRGWKATEASFMLKRLLKTISEQQLRSFNFNNCYMDSIELRYPYFEKCFLGNANLENAYLPFGFFESASLRGTSLIKTNLTKSSFRFADLENAKFHEAVLKEVDFDEAIIYSYAISNRELNKLKSFDKNKLINLGRKYLSNIFGGIKTENFQYVSDLYEICVMYFPNLKFRSYSNNKKGKIYWVLIKKGQKHPNFWKSGFDIIRYRIKKWKQVRKARKKYIKQSQGNINLESHLLISDTTDISKLFVDK